MFEGETNYKKYSGIIRMNVNDWNYEIVQLNGISDNLASDDNEFISKLT